MQDVLAWVKKRRRTIRREDLISFLCGKVPPPRSSRANPRLAMVAPSRANPSAETGSSVETDLQPFREAIALHGEIYVKSLHFMHEIVNLLKTRLSGEVLLATSMYLVLGFRDM